MRLLLTTITASLLLVSTAVMAQDKAAEPIDEHLVTSLLRLDERYMDRLARLERARELRPDAAGKIDDLLAHQDEIYAAELGDLESRYGREQVSLARRGIRVVRTGDDSFILVPSEQEDGPQITPDDTEQRVQAEPSKGRGRGKSGGNAGQPGAGKSGGKPGSAAAERGRGKGRPEHAGNKQVVICWSPPGNPENRRTKRVGLASVEHFLGMGATLGACDDEPTRRADDAQSDEGDDQRDIRIVINGESSIRISEDLVLQPIRDILRKLPGQRNPDEIFKVAREQIGGRDVDKVVAQLSDEIEVDMDLIEARRAANQDDGD